ncbi:Atp-binding protein, partial [Globisporangium polare]
FDSLLLLKRGGETVFFGNLGKRCRNLISYFEAVPDVAPLPKGYNPATWMLECIGAGVGNASADDTDFVQCFKESDQKRILDAEIAKAGVGHPFPGSAELIFTQKRAAPSMTQMKFVVCRYFDMYWRLASFNLSRLFMSVMLAVLFGLVFQGVDYESYQGVNSGIGMIFLVLIFNGLASFESLLPVVIHERASVYRERASETYSAFWYFVASTVAEIPYTFGSGLIFTVIFFPMVGFAGFGAAVLFWLNMSLMILYHAYLGHFLAYALPNHEVAAIIGVLLTSVYFLFMGFSPPTDAIPSWLKWLYYLTPHTYSLAIFSALVFSNCPSNTTFDSTLGEFINVGSELGCQPLKNAPVTMSQVTVKEFTEQVFAMKHDDIGRNFAVVIAFTVMFRVLALLALRFINHQKK